MGHGDVSLQGNEKQVFLVSREGKPCRVRVSQTVWHYSGGPDRDVSCLGPGHVMLLVKARLLSVYMSPNMLCIYASVPLWLSHLFLNLLWNFSIFEIIDFLNDSD